MKTPAKSKSLPSDRDISGRRFGREELANLAEAIASGTLNCTNGTWVKQFEAAFAARFGLNCVRCVTSGTAAVHSAIAAIDPEPGDEVITTPITDMGAIAPILYQTAIPVFADVDPDTYNVTAETIAPKISPRTRAIIVTHLFGNPCAMDPILDLAARHSIPVIEDAAQAYLAEYKGRLAGTFGSISCFSLQQGKHMTTGEGGIAAANEERFKRRLTLFVDKAWGYGDPDPDHYFLALNYRMTELQGAVACAQLEKLDNVVASREAKARALTQMIQGLDGISPPQITGHGRHVYWKYCLQVEPETIKGGVDAFSHALKENFGIFSAPRYIKKPAFQCRVLQEKNTFGSSHFPFSGPHRKGLAEVVYDINEYPGTVKALERICVLPWNENYTAEDVAYIAEALFATAKALKR